MCTFAIRAAAISTLLAAVCVSGADRVFLAQWGTTRVDLKDAVAFQKAVAGHMAVQRPCGTLTFDQARDRLRREGFEVFETCLDAACAAGQARALNCTHAVYGTLARSGNGLWVSLKLVDVSGGNVVRECDRELQGSNTALLSKGVEEVVGVLCTGSGLPPGEPLVVREVIRDRRRERLRLVLGITAGAAAAAIVSTVVITQQADKTENGDAEKTTELIFEW